MCINVSKGRESTDLPPCFSSRPQTAPCCRPPFTTNFKAIRRGPWPLRKFVSWRKRSISIYLSSFRDPSACRRLVSTSLNRWWWHSTPRALSSNFGVCKIGKDRSCSDFLNCPAWFLSWVRDRFLWLPISRCRSTTVVSTKYSFRTCCWRAFV